MSITEAAMAAVEGSPSEILEKKIDMLTQLVGCLEGNFRETTNNHTEKLNYLFQLRKNTELVERIESRLD